EDLVAVGGDDHGLDLRMLEAQAVDRVGELDVDAQIVAVELQDPVAAEGRILLHREDEPRDRPVDAELPVAVPIRMGRERQELHVGRGYAAAPRMQALYCLQSDFRGTILLTMSARVLELAGRRVRERRQQLGWSQRQLAERAHLSVRFLAQLEHGVGNSSLPRFAAVAEALGVEVIQLLRAGEPAPASTAHVALLGLRGAGKSTIGARLARALGVPFVELDDLVARVAGIGLAEIFLLHGEAY